jgi:hypothetical protein
MSLTTTMLLSVGLALVPAPALIVGIPGFLAALGYGMYFAFHR